MTASLPAKAPRGTPADLLALGLGSGDGAQLEEELDLGAFLCACPELELHGCLGRGGMGLVYRARQVRLDRDVAVKLMSPELANDPEFADRFEREAKALARLHHPGIVGVHDFGEAAGVYYIVMELVDGPSLRDLMAQEVASAQASEIVAQMCDALAYAHEQGVVHRDIKPENVLIDRAGRVRIADFGLAKMQREAAAGTAMRTRRVLGTPQYMAPEQIRDPGTVDHRSDIFAIGVVFYELLTGQLPVGRFPSPSELGNGDARLDEIVLRALESNRERRFQAASEIAAALSTIGATAAPSLHDGVASRRRRFLPWAVAGSAAAAAAVLAWQLNPAPQTPVVEDPAPAAETASARPPVARDRWPAREIGLLDPSVAGVVGMDWSELRQAPVIARALGAAALLEGQEAAGRCKTEVIDRTHKLIAGFTADGEPVDMILHADWELDALESCFTAVGSRLRDDGEPMHLIWKSEPLGPHRRLHVTRGEKTYVVSIGKRDATIVMTKREVTAEQIDAMLVGTPTSAALGERVLASLDLSAPIWVFAEPNPERLPLKMTAFYGTIDVWEKVGVQATVEFVDDAAATSAKTLIESYANVIASIPAAEETPKVEVLLDGKQIHAKASLAVPELGASGSSDFSLNINVGK